MAKKSPPYWREVFQAAKEDVSILEVVGESLAGIMLTFVATVLGVANRSEMKELFFLMVGGAIAVPLFIFILRAMLVTPGKIFRKLTERIEALEEKLTPKFKLECGPKTPGRVTIVLGRGMFYRLQVTVDCASEIQNCRGYLTKIEKNGMEVFNNESLELPFAPSESDDAWSKTVSPNIPYYLDVLRVPYGANCPEVATKGNRALVVSSLRDLVFLSPGEYILHVSVSGNGVGTVSARLKFDWKDRPMDATIEKLDS
jgi:hypothetical protein